MKERILFVTGRLAEPSLRRVVDAFAPMAGIEPLYAVLPITVAALASTHWMTERVQIPEGITRVVLPGLCPGELDSLACWNVPVQRGPNDLLDLTSYFCQPVIPPDLSRHSIEILAEINHAPRLEKDELLRQARALIRSGADRIDLGCDAGAVWGGVGDAVKALVAKGIRVSIDSFEPTEVSQAVRAGADLVLSVNAGNRERAADWGVEVVAIPDRPGAPESLQELQETAEFLHSAGVAFRLDPILEPIGHGLGSSLLRYARLPELFPGVPVLMGVGNVTELAEVDSSGIHLTLLALAREWGVSSVLTTSVANWCLSAVEEIDHLRRVVELAIGGKRLAKYLDPAVLLLRDRRQLIRGEEGLLELKAGIKDSNFRVIAERGELHVMNSTTWLREKDPFVLFAELFRRENLDPTHAFYLGYEISKAVTALTLGKAYVQDRALDWGFLTRSEVAHRVDLGGAQ